MPRFIPINPALQRLNDAGKMIVRRAARYKEKREAYGLFLPRLLHSCCSDRTKQRQSTCWLRPLTPHIGHKCLCTAFCKADMDSTTSHGDVNKQAQSLAARAFNEASDQSLRKAICWSSSAKLRAVPCRRITPMKSYASLDLGTNQ